jgi:hypothetical protein
VGADLSKVALGRASRREENVQAGFDFFHHDIVNDRVDSSVYDVVMLRDVIQHMSVSNGAKAVTNIADSGVQYLVATTVPFMPNNTAQDLTAPCYSNNMGLPPFNLQSPLEDCENHTPPAHQADGTRLQLFRLNPAPLQARDDL